MKRLSTYELDNISTYEKEDQNPPMSASSS
jgi:hypothetical protein